MDSHVPPPAEDRPLPTTTTAPPPDPSAWVTRAVVTFLIGVLVLVVGVYLVLTLRHFLLLVVVAFFLSFAMEPAVTWFDRRGWRRGAATAVVILTALVITVVVLFSVGRLVFAQTAQLIDRAPQLIEDGAAQINNWFGSDLDAQALSAEVANLDLPIQDIASGLAGGALSLTSCKSVACVSL